jgi:RimJ/RimL family protein N-acetyltransferase
MPSIPQPPERLGDDLIELREIAEWDIPDTLIAFEDDRELHRRIGWRKPPTGAQLGMEVEHELEERLAGNALRLTLVERGGRDWRGRLTLYGFDWGEASASLQVFMAPAARGRGYEQRAVGLVSRWLFDNVAVDRLTVSVDGAGTETLSRDDPTF